MNRKKRRIRKLKKILASLLMVLGIILFGGVLFTGKVYFDFKNIASETHYALKDSGHQDPVKSDQPINILLLGIDTGSLGRIDTGRSDSMIIATINPKKKKILLTSLERDTYTEIIGENKNDKLNHAYAYGGPSSSIATVENLLNIHIDHFALINMKGIEDLVDSVEGVTVNNSFAFNYNGTDFPKGIQTLNGEEALNYSRMRYSDPDGNYGRQNRQRQVLTALSKKIVSTNAISKYQSILMTLGRNVRTDLTFDDLKTLSVEAVKASSTIKSEQLRGTSFMQDNTSYQNVSYSEKQRVKEEIIAFLKK